MPHHFMPGDAVWVDWPAKGGIIPGHVETATFYRNGKADYRIRVAGREGRGDAIGWFFDGQVFATEAEALVEVAARRAEDGGEE